MLKLFNGISIHLKINQYCVCDTHVGQICISHADTFIYIHTQKHMHTYIHTHTQHTHINIMMPKLLPMMRITVIYYVQLFSKYYYETEMSFTRN